MSDEIERIDPDAAIELARAAVEDAKSVAAAPGTGSTLATRGAANALETKAKLGEAFSSLATVHKAAAEKIEEARAMIAAKERELDRQRRELEAELAPLLKQMDRLKDGITAVNLYLGRDEELEELRGGESAPVDTPLIIRQSVLAMDEETALDAEGGGLDFKNLTVFVDWLLESEEHLNQVIPDAKGVVTFMARKTPVDYSGDALADAEKNKLNFLTHWLIRNGERLYLMTTDFSVGTLLIPTRRSFTKLFEDEEGNELIPGSDKWRKAEELADGITRHYMKVALILQGLADRTAVFHPLPGGKLDLLGNADYDAGRVVLLEEEEKAITSGRQPFKEWLAERLDLLEVGQRVIGWFPTGYGESSHTTPAWTSEPSRSVAHVITREDSRNFYFAFDRTDEVAKKNRYGDFIGYGPAEARASYRIHKDELHSASFVPIDTVTVAEMQEYLEARTERHAYKNMFPALTAAIAFKEAEEEAERPFRELLFWKLEEANSPDDEEVRELVRWWKTANKWHRPLNGAPEHEARAVRMILAEYARRHQPVDPRGMKALNGVADAMVLARRTNDLVAVVPEPRDYFKESVPQNMFVSLHFFSPTGRIREVRRWATLTRAQVAKWTILGETADWARWMLNPSGDHLSDPEIKKLITATHVIAETAKRGPLSVIKYVEERDFIRITGYFASELQERNRLRQPYFELYAKSVRGVGKLVSAYGDPVSKLFVHEHDWRMSGGTRYNPETRNFEKVPNLPEAPHGVNYEGAHPRSVVYADAEMLEADLRLAAKWADRTRRDEKERARRDAVARALWSGWQTLETEIRRQRFIEDFGNAELWEDHAKSQKSIPFPLEHNLGSAPIAAFAKTVVSAGIDVHGMTVEEALEVVGPVKGIPAELLPVVLVMRKDEA